LPKFQSLQIKWGRTKLLIATGSIFDKLHINRIAIRSGQILPSKEARSHGANDYFETDKIQQKIHENFEAVIVIPNLIIYYIYIAIF